MLIYPPALASFVYTVSSTGMLIYPPALASFYLLADWDHYTGGGYREKWKEKYVLQYI
jgi:hypothetical protein